MYARKMVQNLGEKNWGYLRPKKIGAIDYGQANAGRAAKATHGTQVSS